MKKIVANPRGMYLVCLLACGAAGCNEDEGLLDPWAVSSSQYQQIGSVILDTQLVETTLSQSGVDVLNPGMAIWRGETWMALRVDRFDAQARTGCDVEHTVVMVRVDEDFQPNSDYYPLDFAHPGGACSTAEDPRLVSDGEHLYLVYNALSVTDDASTGIRRIFFAELTMQGGAPQVLYTRQLESPHYPLQRIEKNWTPFASEAGIHLIYNTDPAVVFLLPHKRLARLRKSTSMAGTLRLPPPSESSAPEAPLGEYGVRRGGTQAIFEPQLGQYVSFSHSSTPLGNHGQRIYFAGFYTFEPKPPFDTVSHLQQPLDVPFISPTKNGFLKVVFPGGVIDLGDRYAVAFGQDDLAAGVTIVDKARLFEELSPIR